MADQVQGRSDRSGAPFLIAVVIVVVGLLAIWLSGGFHRAIHHLEITNGPSATYADASTGVGAQGQALTGQETLHIECKLVGHAFTASDHWWYRIAAPPWDDKFYAPAHAFYNDGRTHGTEKIHELVDRDVPTC